MRFSQENFSITLDGKEVKLLRKEFLLLKYLYENRERAFSRDELLDAVWPLEEPTIRTVDDHIYRLRKKLFSFQNMLTINTVKGLGYYLQLKDQNKFSIPVPEEITQQANQLLNTFYKYGQGKVLKEILTNETLGFFINDKQETVLLWLRSDFVSLLKKMNTIENIFVPLLLYGFIESDTEKVIKIHEKVLQKNILSEKERMDISCFSLPMWYLKSNKPKISLQLVQKELNAIQKTNHGFLPFLKIMKTSIYLYENRIKKVKSELIEVENMLIRLPFLREQGALKVLKGLILIKKRRENDGQNIINDGIQVIHQSGHTYYFLLIYQILNLLLPKVGASSELINYYKKEEVNYCRSTNLYDLKKEIENQIFDYI
ncbi:winged helix-turn-helix domain-containing protein [Oceanobacillus kimchii]|uniref:winged helix-turn-helix domain-containing protein n=1 Tax=Oceanobacillus kimchii TaxID=746691 RepID=UPI003B0251FD